MYCISYIFGRLQIEGFTCFFFLKIITLCNRIFCQRDNLVFFFENVTENGIRKKKKSEKLFWVGGFWYGSVDLPETQIFFF